MQCLLLSTKYSEKNKFFVAIRTEMNHPLFMLFRFPSLFFAGGRQDIEISQNFNILNLEEYTTSYMEYMELI